MRFKLQLTTPACPVKAEFERQVHLALMFACVETWCERTEQLSNFMAGSAELTAVLCGIIPTRFTLVPQARQFVGELPWVRDIQLEMGADPPKPIQPTCKRQILRSHS